MDSAVAAHLLKEAGYEVTGVTMRLWTGCDDASAMARRTCCSLADIRDAAQVARVLGIEHLVVDLREEFYHWVVEPFVREYLAGRTPNPCILCNRAIKFESLLSMGRAMGSSYLATGHYARIKRDAKGYHLLRGVDGEKDQSYALYMVDQETLSLLLFPNGDYNKEQIRQKARELGFSIAGKEESQEICFLSGSDYRDFILERFPEAGRPGLILDTSGRILGWHRGIINYTVGQRKGLGIASPYPLYVLKVDPVSNVVVVGRREEAGGLRLVADQASWVAGEPPGKEFRAEVKIRYRMESIPGRVKVNDGSVFQVYFEEPAWAITPGQSVVLYDGDEILGGGIIVEGSRGQ